MQPHLLAVILLGSDDDVTFPGPLIHYHQRDFAAVVDLLRNEKPTYVALGEPDVEDGLWVTFEKAGENEPKP